MSSTTGRSGREFGPSTSAADRGGAGEQFAGHRVELTGVAQLIGRRNVPIVDGVTARCPRTIWVAPARRTATSLNQSPTRQRRVDH
jgi:hypothetical protein